MSRRARVLGVFAVCLGCSTPPASEPPKTKPGPSKSRSIPNAACEAQRVALAAELCEPEDECETDELPCLHLLDFDGDGADERVEFAQVNGALALRVQFGHGPEQVVGATHTPVAEYLEPDELLAGEPRMLPPDWTWIAAWSPAPREGDQLVHGRMRFEAGPARGDGLWLSGSDAAAMLILTNDGWLVLELGY